LVIPAYQTAFSTKNTSHLLKKNHGTQKMLEKIAEKADLVKINNLE